MNAVRALPVVALALTACGDSTPLTLRYQPRAGSTFRYVLNQEVTIRAEGPEAGAADGQQLTIRIAFTQSVKGPVEGGIEVVVRVDSVAVTSPQFPSAAMSQATQMLQGLESHIVFDDRMQVVRSEVSDAAGVPPQLANQIVTGLRGASFPLPDHPLRVGESWSVDMAAPTGVPGMTAPLKLRYTLTLKGVRASGADTVVRLALETSFPKEPISLGGDGPPSTMRFDGSLRGEQEYSLSRGAIVRVALSGSLRVSTSGGGLGEGAMVMDQRLGLELLESAATP